MSRHGAAQPRCRRDRAAWRGALASRALAPRALALATLLAALLPPLAGGTTRFVRVGNTIEPAPPLEPLELHVTSDMPDDVIIDYGYLFLAHSQPLPVVKANSQARRPSPADDRLAEEDDASTDALRSLDLTVAEQAYLYDDVFLPGNKHLSEAFIATSERHQSRLGNDHPNWKDLRTPWDSLKGVSLRNYHALSHAEDEIKTIFQDQGGVAKARDRLQRHLLDVGRDRPNLWADWNELGNTFRATGEVHRAIQCFRRALYIRPDDPDVLLNLAVVLQNIGFLDDAEQIMAHCTTIMPGGVLHRFIYANILQEQGKIMEAIESYSMTLEMQSSFLPSAKKLQDLGWGDRVKVDATPAEMASADFALATSDAAVVTTKMQGGQHGLQHAANARASIDGSSSVAGSLDLDFPSLIGHFIGLVLFLLGAVLLLTWTDDLDEEVDEAADSLSRAARRKLGNRKKAKGRQRLAPGPAS